MTRRERAESTAEQIDAAIDAASIRFVYARDAYDEPLSPGGDWQRLIPPHVAIAALDREVRRYSEVLHELHAERDELRRTVNRFESAARAVLAEQADQ